MSLKDFCYSEKKNNLAKKFIVPKSVVCQDGAENTHYLLKDTLRQPIHRNGIETCTIRKGGYVLLDFGSELHGGIEINVNSVEDVNSTGETCISTRIHIVFGESVSEALSDIGDGKGAVNDHSTRDMIVHTTSLSNMRYGNTGFRFVRIEALDAGISMAGVKGVLEYKDIEYKGTFMCSDEKINKIFDTAVYTVHLNMGDYVWDGIKRDRLVWIGDFHPEMSAISTVFGYDECVENTLDFARDNYPIDETNKWMIFASYSAWWIVAHRDWYMQNGRYEYLLEQRDYLYKLAENFINSILPDGTLKFGDAHYFVDWSSCDTEWMEAGFRGCIKLGLEASADIFEVYGDKKMSQKCIESASYLGKVSVPYEGNKQVCAMVGLSELYGKDVTDTLSYDLPYGMSTFYGYYVLLALAKGGKTPEAIDAMRSYWGAMLDMGATTFWEDFDMKWLKNASGICEIPTADKNDIHATYGKFCYEKLRLSLCHGWSCGPAPFALKHILGVKILKPGCKRISIEPHLGNLTWAKGTYPTPYGVVQIEHKVTDGKTVTTVNAPKEVEIV